MRAKPTPRSRSAFDAQPTWPDRTVEERRPYPPRDRAAARARPRRGSPPSVSAETGKSPKDALGETGGAIELGYFIAGERAAFLRQDDAERDAEPLGADASPAARGRRLIIAANTPIANVAWKVFPALLCGNAAVLKASEDTPETALVFSRLAAEAGLPPGVLNVVQGYGEEAGQPLVEDRRVAVVSFTDRPSVGRMIARVAGERLAKVCLELGGKNPLVVCDDAKPRAGRGDRRALGVLERGPALRGRLAPDRLRLRLRPFPRAAARAHGRAEGRARTTSTTSAR
jgi:aldehyde dehydrogenase (NAD+)